MASRKRRANGTPKATGMRQGLATYGDAGFSLFLRKAFIKAGGYSDDALDRPIVGITNTFSDYNPCHGNVPDLIEAVKRGVMLAGALPMVFPTISIHESFSHPDQHVPAQPHVDGHRGDDPRPADGFGGADRRLRQDPAGPAHGRGERRSARRRAAGRADAGRPLQGRGAGRLHRLPPPVGPVSRRHLLRGRHREGERAAGADQGHLHGDGHRQHHGLHRRDAGHGPARQRLDTGDAFRPPARRRSDRQACRRDGEEAGPAPQRDHDGRRLPQRADGAAGDRRLDQRAGPSHRHRAPSRRRHRAR